MSITSCSQPSRQSGGAMMVMLVILVIGITTIFATTLSKVSIANKKHNKTAEALAMAKEALIGYAISDPNRPGELPCPDTNNDGSAESNCSAASNTLIGRLPWRTLDLPDPRDSAAEPLWYVVSDAFHANGPTAINSDTNGTISINGTNGYVAVVIAAENTLSAVNQDRTPANINNYQHYLESVNSQTSIQQQTPNDIPSGAHTYNDQLVAIGRDDFMPQVEQRIAREVRSCLDSYAQASSNKYPWASSVSDTTNYYGVKYKRFGRIAASRLNVLTTNSSYLSFMNKIDAVQIALNSYINNPTSSNLSNLSSAGDTLKDASRPSGFPEDAYDYAHTAGYRADNLPSNPDNVTQSNLDGIQSKLNSSYANMASNGLTDGNMQSNWTCSLLNSVGNYWDDWKNTVFYQVSSSFAPGSSSASCDASTCLTINGSGTYRAVVALGRKLLPTINSDPRNVSTPSDYLEGINQLNKTGASPTRVFEAYQASEANYNSVNDLVLCADGKVNCL